MKCPICSVDLQMTERQGIEIDYCAQCRGVWLDRGELDKIIDKSSTRSTMTENRVSEISPISKGQNSYYGHNDNHEDYGYKNKKHKKESLLGELFDF